MGRAGRKRAARTTIFYICALIAVALVWMNKSSIWLGIIVFFNALAEAFDSLAGK